MERLPTGLKALWFRLIGRYKTIKKQNEAETKIAKTRDRSELQTVIDRQQSERRRLQHEVRSMRYRHALGIKKLNRDMAELQKLNPNQQDNVFRQKQQRRQQKCSYSQTREPTMYR